MFFAAKKMQLTKIMFPAAVQASDVNNTSEPQEFLEFVNESGCGSDI